MKKKKSAGGANRSKSIKDHISQKAAEVKAGRMQSTHNSKGPNPIVISRDRALGNG